MIVQRRRNKSSEQENSSQSRVNKDIDEDKNGHLQINRPKDFEDSKQINDLSIKDRNSSMVIDPRTGALAAWNKENLNINSPIKDLFAGQTACTVTCGECDAKTVTHELFYSLSLPIPFVNELMMFVYVVKRVKKRTQHSLCDCYGLTLQKDNATLKDLLEQLSELSGVDAERFTLAEINGSKYIKMLSVSNINSESLITSLGLRSRRIFAFEQMDMASMKQRYYNDTKILYRMKGKPKKRHYKSKEAIK